jgi:phosphate transport system permease protein
LSTTLALVSTWSLSATLSLIANRLPTSLFSPGTSIASTLANEFGEAADFHLSTLFALGFLLFVITFVVLSLAKILILRAEKGKGL